MGFQVNDVMYEVLGLLGYTGTLTERIYKHLGDMGYRQLSMSDRLKGVGGFKEYQKVLIGGSSDVWAMPTLMLDLSRDTYALGSGGILEEVGFGDLITFTRASGGGRFNSAGTFEYLGSNLPRLDYDPVTLQPRGILIEEARTNLLLRSSEFDNASWAKTDNTVAANVETSPDGSVDADRLTQGGAGTASVSQDVTVSSGATASFSIRVKPITGQFLRVIVSNNTLSNGFGLWCDLLAGSVTASAAFGTGTISATSCKPIGGGYFEITITGAIPATTVYRSLMYIATASGVSTRLTGAVYVPWGAQLEAGAFPTSYIPTVASTVTRAADVARVSTLSPWYNSLEGTILAEFSQLGVGTGIGRVFSFNNNVNTNDLIDLGRNAAGVQTVVNAVGPAQSNLIEQAPLAATGSVIKAATGYKLNDFALSVNGKAALTDSAGLVPTVTTLQLGARLAGTFMLNGHIRSLRYWPRRDMPIQGMTL